jgi:hypothetical protein
LTAFETFSAFSNVNSPTFRGRQRARSKKVNKTTVNVATDGAVDGSDGGVRGEKRKKQDGKERRTTKRASRKRKTRNALDFPLVTKDILPKSKRGFKFFFGFF